MPADSPELQRRAVALLLRFEEVRAIGLAGSQALGVQDAYSDLDLLVVATNRFPDFQARKRVYESVDGLRPPPGEHVVSVGYDQPPLSIRFVVDQCELDGTACDFLWTTQDGWQAMLSAVIESPDRPEWLVAGIQTVVPLVDPDGLIAALQHSVPEYPVSRALDKARQCIGPAHFWLCRVGCLQKAAFRGDVVEYHKREAEMVDCLVGALYAVNRIWQLDSRRLAAGAAAFEIVPDGFVERLTAMLLRRDRYRDLSACDSELKSLFRDVAAKANAKYPDWNLPAEWPSRC